VRHAVQVPSTREATQRTFWWDRAPVDAVAYRLRAVLFDLDGAVADIERDGHRVAFNAAFAAHGLDIAWDVDEYRRLLAIPDEQQRISAELRKRGFGSSSNELAAEIHSTKTEWFDDCVLDSVVEPRPGVIDLVMSLFVAGIWVGVVSNGRRQLVEPLVRQLLGDGLVETIVTADDVEPGKSAVEFYKLVLWEFGIGPEGALAVAGSVPGMRAALAAGVPTVVVPTDYTADHDFTGAAAVLPGIDGSAADWQRLHRRWSVAKSRAA
jgi:beta-phosphoglucomutase-like phosphatase (HAD superfamily)